MNIKPFPTQTYDLCHRGNASGCQAQVWRRIQLPGATRLDRVHHILQHTLDGRIATPINSGRKIGSMGA